MKRKKIGSTLITVVTICSAVLITGTALVAMTAGDYKMKQQQSNRTHNLYGADSGLDGAYDVLVADFDAAGNYAGFRIQQLKAGKEKIDGNLTENQIKYNVLIDEDDNLEKNNPDKDQDWYETQRQRIQKNKDIVINAEFQRSFKLFLNSGWAKYYKGEYLPNELEEIDKHNDDKSIDYVAQFEAPGEGDNNSSVDLDGTITSSNFLQRSVEVKGNPVITIEDSGIALNGKAVTDTSDSDEVDVPFGGDAAPDNYKVKQSAKLTIKSTFETSKGENGEAVVGSNKRTVESTYNIVIPNYDDIYFTDQESKTYIYDAYKDKGITVFGNMQVKDMGTSKFTVDNGDIFVLGNKSNLPSSDSASDSETNISSAHIIDKYKGGISLDGNSTAKTTMEFKGNVFTGGTFNIEKNVDATLSKDLYALNVYAGKQNGGAGDNSNLNIDGSMVVDNDLTLKSTSTKISMNNFYGINDIHVKDNLDSNKDRNSSSILVNTYKDDNDEKKSSVNISGEAYILGVAYIDTDAPYQTGESVGVKGNYKAYSEDSTVDQGKFTFGIENSPLYLIDGKVQDNGTVDKNVTVDDKEQHFYNFWNDNKSDLDTGGVMLPKAIGNIHSAGAVVYKDVDGNKYLQKSSYDLDNTPSTILGMREAFAKNIYNLGKDPVDASKSGKTEKDLLDEIYANPYSRDTIISKFMDLSKVDDAQSGKNITNDKYRGIFNKDSSKKIIIKGIDSTYTASDNDIVIDASSGELDAFIATAGDLIIDGKVNIKGNIIVQENLIVQGSGDKTIEYDERAGQAIQEKVPSLFKNVFNKLGVSTGGDSGVDESNLKIDYDLGKFLNGILWKIIK